MSSGHTLRSRAILTVRIESWHMWDMRSPHVCTSQSSHFVRSDALRHFRFAAGSRYSLHLLTPTTLLISRPLVHTIHALALTISRNFTAVWPRRSTSLFPPITSRRSLTLPTDGRRRAPTYSPSPGHTRQIFSISCTPAVAPPKCPAKAANVPCCAVCRRIKAPAWSPTTNRHPSEGSARWSG